MFDINAYMTAQLLDDPVARPREEPVGGPQSAPRPPQYPSPTAGPMGPTGAPMGPMGGFQADPELQRKAQIMDMFSNLNRVGGGAGLSNPFADQIAMNQKMQMERIRQLQSRATAAPSSVREFEYFQGLDEEGREQYLKVKRGDQRTARQKDADYLLNATQEERKAYFEQKGITTKELADGSLIAVDAEGNQTGVLFSAEDAQLGAAGLAAAKAEGEGRVKYDFDRLTRADEQLIESQSEFEKNAAAIQLGQQALDLFADKVDENGNTIEGLETNFVKGQIMKIFGIGDADMAELEALSGQALLQALGSASLVPVSDRDIRTLESLFASVSQEPDVAMAKLRVFLRSKRNAQKAIRNKSNRLIDSLGTSQYVDQFRDQYGDVLNYQDPTDDPEAVLGGR